ncbi:MAG: hypothetical protein L0M05_08150 [Corynebacterium variabile]|uniref:hypothetical protein n=1 Tax=Corynebacterium variabile TaxID=1727 RepID=UPI00264A1E6C|nr:hypothetical protein [Corynebacterium variabile]MDN6844750.1 hypothetical protein [Corynebacterium variabile]
MDDLWSVRVGDVIELADVDRRSVVVADRVIPLVYRSGAQDAPDVSGHPVTVPGRQISDHDRKRVEGLVEYLRVCPDKVRVAVLRQADWPVAVVRDRGLVCGALVVDLAASRTSAQAATQSAGPTTTLAELTVTPVGTEVELRQRYRALAQLCVLLDTFRSNGRDLVGLTEDAVRVGERGRNVVLTAAADLEVGALLVTLPEEHTFLNDASAFAALVVRVLVGRRDVTVGDLEDLPPDVRTLVRHSLEAAGPSGGGIPDFLSWWSVLKTVATGVIRHPRPEITPEPTPVAPAPVEPALPAPRRAPVADMVPGMVTVLGALLLLIGVIGLVAGAGWAVPAVVAGAMAAVGGLVTGVWAMRRREERQLTPPSAPPSTPPPARSSR